MKKLCIYSMRTGTRKVSFALFSLIWEHVHQTSQTFTFLYVSVNDHENKMNMDLGLKINFSE